MSKLFLILGAISLSVVTTVEAGMDKSQYGQKIMELVEVLHNGCSMKSGASEESIKKAANGEFVDEPKIKAYMICALTDSGAMDDKGVWNFDLVKELLPPKYREEIIKNIKTCYQKGKGIPNSPDRIFAFFKCLYETKPDLYIFF